MPTTQTFYLHRDGKSYPFRYCKGAPALVNKSYKSGEYHHTHNHVGAKWAGWVTGTTVGSTVRGVEVAGQPGVIIVPNNLSTLKIGTLDGSGIVDTGAVIGATQMVPMISDDIMQHPLRQDDLVTTMWEITTEKETGTQIKLYADFQKGDIFSNAPVLGMDDDAPDA